MKLRKTLAMITAFVLLGTGCSASPDTSVSGNDKDTTVSASASQSSGGTAAATPANWDEAPTSAASAVDGEWTETPYEAEFYVIVDCYAREKALLGAKTVSVITRNGKIKVVAKTDTGYYKLPDGTFVHGDYLSVEKPSGDIFTSAGAQTGSPASDAPAAAVTTAPDAAPAPSSGYRWVTEPKYDYENVKMLMLFGGIPFGKASLAAPSNGGDYDYTPGKSFSGLFVAENDDNKQLIDLDGNKIIEGSYDDIQSEWFFWDYYIACITYGYDEVDAIETEEVYWVDDNYSLVDPSRGLGGYFGTYYYYDSASGMISVIDYGDEQTVTPSSLGSECVPVTDEETYFCGLLSNGKFIVPLEYDGFFDASFYPYNADGNRENSPFVDGRIVFYKDDKIYVFDKDGNCVSSGKYDNEYNDNQEQCYHDGYLPVCRNEKWGLIDLNGSEVVPCRFDDISSVWNGKAWAMENGKWGVIEVAPVRG